MMFCWNLLWGLLQKMIVSNCRVSARTLYEGRFDNILMWILIEWNQHNRLGQLRTVYVEVRFINISYIILLIFVEMKYWYNREGVVREVVIHIAWTVIFVIVVGENQGQFKQQRLPCRDVLCICLCHVTKDSFLPWNSYCIYVKIHLHNQYKATCWSRVATTRNVKFRFTFLAINVNRFGNRFRL